MKKNSKINLFYVVAICAITLVIGSFCQNQNIYLAEELESVENISYQNHYFYGEALHIQTMQSVEKYVLIDQNTGQIITFSGQLIDEGIDLAQMPISTYDIHINGDRLISESFISQTWYTITRDNKAKQVILETNGEIVQLVINEVDELPDDVYDIIIDPGHGGIDSGAIGNGLLESEEVLKISEYIVDELTKLGLKVKLTRTGDYEPAGDETFNSETSAYYEDGRIEQVYENQAKLFISNHLNSTESGEASGFQIYGSFLSSNNLASLLSDQLQKVGLSPAIVENYMSSDDSVMQMTDICEELITDANNCRFDQEDYYYVVRESGGYATSAQKISLYNNSYLEVPNYGAEGILIEYAFIDNLNDNNLWQKNWQSYGDAIVNAIVDYIS